MGIAAININAMMIATVTTVGARRRCPTMQEHSRSGTHDVLVSYHRIHMAMEIASDLPALFVVVDSLLPTTIAKYHGNNYLITRQCVVD